MLKKVPNSLTVYDAKKFEILVFEINFEITIFEITFLSKLILRNTRDIFRNCLIRNCRLSPKKSRISILTA